MFADVRLVGSREREERDIFWNDFKCFLANSGRFCGRVWKYAQIWTLMGEGTITGFGDNRILQGEAENTEVIKAYGGPV